jgi:predicted DNA-binding transcriptional regulator YafY
MLLPTKSRSQLADEYGVSRRTFYNWLKKEGIELPKRMLTPPEIEQIYSMFGDPDKWTKKRTP